MNALYQRKIVVNGELKEASSVQTKVEQDIAFLQHRINLMKKQKIPNSVVIETYENMLKSRQSVLAWLQDGNSEQELKLV
ncbi:hypothetical protein [Cellvibrio sp.]|mgnify:CR=1 FL=1|jgi:hypothetical protein|uniref:hypothetical protein n=1 Tax=Cellvibrio sp. TaxID=1965322 RepID=UPI0039648AF9